MGYRRVYLIKKFASSSGFVPSRNNAKKSYKKN